MFNHFTFYSDFPFEFKHANASKFMVRWGKKTNVFQQNRELLVRKLVKNICRYIKRCLYTLSPIIILSAEPNLI